LSDGASCVRRCTSTEIADALHGDRAVQRPRPHTRLQTRARFRDKISRRTELCRELNRAQLRPLLPADGMRRCAAAAGMDPELPGAGDDLRDRARRAEQGNARSRRVVFGCKRHTQTIPVILRSAHLRASRRTTARAAHPSRLAALGPQDDGSQTSSPSLCAVCWGDRHRTS
jgi:hypothetical protein